MFDPNPFFENNEIIKEFQLGGIEPTSSTTEIKWKPGKKKASFGLVVLTGLYPKKCALGGNMNATFFHAGPTTILKNKKYMGNFYLRQLPCSESSNTENHTIFPPNLQSNSLLRLRLTFDELFRILCFYFPQNFVK